MPPNKNSVPTNFLTFDIEEWYHANYEGLDISQFKDRPVEFRRLMDRLLHLCEYGGFKSTFFVLGSIAEKYPDIVKAIQSAGHEVASHGYGHELVYKMTPAQFRADLQKSSTILEDITGNKVQGFRAPSFSVNIDCADWYYRTLEERGFLYSSSVFAGKTFLYGIPGFPDNVHQPILADGRQTTIWEFPIPSIQVLGLSVGMYIRLFPAWLIRKLILGRNSDGKSQMLYLHPREIDPLQPRLPLPATTSFIHYFGINGCESKLKSVFRNNASRFGTLAGYVEQQTVPA
jgi:polysaccharide deacetylase family protein (PEP-CTERM system associated)